MTDNSNIFKIHLFNFLTQIQMTGKYLFYYRYKVYVHTFYEFHGDTTILKLQIFKMIHFSN